MDDLGQEYITLARQMTTNGCLSKAFDYYMQAFEKCADLKAMYVAEFRVVLNRLSTILHATNKIEEIFNNYSRALKSFPTNIYVINDTGRYLYKFGFYQEAWAHFAKALSLDPCYVNAENNLNSLKNLLVERWHFRMLNDKTRNMAYRTAIHQSIKRGRDSVLDIGTGTGLLALYANECTPIVITALDGSEVMSGFANTITGENDAENVIVLNKISTGLNYLDIGGKRTLIITEMFDAGLFGEHILVTLLHAWENFIAKGGKVMPNKAEFFVMGAKSDFLNRRYQLCSSMKSYLKVPTLHVHSLTRNETYDCEDVHLYGDDIKYMTDAQSLIKIDFNNYNEIDDALKRTEPYEVELQALENGQINTVVGFFNLYLTDKVTLTTDPRSERRANAWQQAIFFDNIPKQINENDTFKLEFLLNGGKLTMLPELPNPITRISPNMLRFLNDTEYMKMISGCIGMASVYLGQISDMSQIAIADLCPFPMFGLQLMKRGARSLICCAINNYDKHFLTSVFEANGIPSSKLTVLIDENWPKEEFKEKYHAVFSNIMDLSGEFDMHLKDIALHLRENNLLSGGLFLPSNINIMGQLVKSNWLDINNQLYDENVNNYPISKYLNEYRISQNFCIDFSHLEYTPLSEPCIMGTWDTPFGSEVVAMPIIKNGNANAILCWYTIELMENLNEISTNRKNSFIDGILFLTRKPEPVTEGQVAQVLCCVDTAGAFKLMMHVEET